AADGADLRAEEADVLGGRKCKSTFVRYELKKSLAEPDDLFSTKTRAAGPGCGAAGAQGEQTEGSHDCDEQSGSGCRVRHGGRDADAAIRDLSLRPGQGCQAVH